MNQLHHFLVVCKSLLRQKILYFAVVAVFLIVALGGYFFEHEKNDSISGMWDAIYWAVTTLSTVGYGDIYPVTVGGRLISMFAQICGVGILGLLAATIAAFIIELGMRERRGQNKMKEKGHGVICGWNADGEYLVKELLSKGIESLVVIANLSEKPIDHEKVHFVAGIGKKEGVLEQAKVQKAKVAVVLANDPSKPVESDALTFMICNAMHNYAPQIRMVADVVDVESESLFKKDLPDCAIVNISRIGARLLAEAVTDAS